MAGEVDGMFAGFSDAFNEGITGLLTLPDAETILRRAI
jgi:hypothetical protein